MDVLPLLDHSTGQQANPFLQDSGIYKELQTKPLLRVWDTFSGSIPSGNRMLARRPREELATNDARKTSLTLHANHKNHEVPTPYISFTSCPHAAKRLANKRINEGRRGDQNLVVIDPWYRLQHGLPILDMAKEAEWYGIDSPYRENYFTDHYVCLWEVTPAEVVGTCRWDELCRDNGWYENIVMPAFERHRAAR
jgi:hypothetical protein